MLSNAPGISIYSLESAPFKLTKVGHIDLGGVSLLHVYCTNIPRNTEMLVTKTPPLLSPPNLIWASSLPHSAQLTNLSCALSAPLDLTDFRTVCLPICLCVGLSVIRSLHLLFLIGITQIHSSKHNEQTN